MKEPSERAFRATRKIVERVPTLTWKGFFPRSDIRNVELATIIDKETGLPELEARLADAIEIVKWVSSKIRPDFPKRKTVYLGLMPLNLANKAKAITKARVESDE